MNAAKKRLHTVVQIKNAALLHSLCVCMFAGLATLAGQSAAQTAVAQPPSAASIQPAAKPLAPSQQAYEKTAAMEQKKYDMALNACASQLAPAQCKRQARLSKEQALHTAKLARAEQKNEEAKASLAQKSAQKNPPNASARPPVAAADKKPVANRAAPPKLKHKAGALSSQPSDQARRAHVAKQANLEENLAKLKAQSNSKAAQREAKNQKRREAGYAVDSRPAP